MGGTHMCEPKKKKFFFVCLSEGRRGGDAGLPASTLASPDVPSIGAGRKNFKVFPFPKEAKDFVIFFAFSPWPACRAPFAAGTIARLDVPSIGAGRKNFKVFPFPKEGKDFVT